MDKNENDIFDLIATHVADISLDIADGPIIRSSMLSPLGMDSIGRAELIARMLEELSLTASAREFYKANNLGELAALFVNKLKEQ
ncbi:phosphopantetheine-binding protein [Aquimarina sp. AU58]|uniref:phosphopantetheine-binding protein n=1 Tax=Aquimarina sp. AU58 TaxID=1874112 RepID=UPI000D6E27E3|nr:phosphopantetheine-binding protein [Aquimarina sp. AU58]